MDYPEAVVTLGLAREVAYHAGIDYHTASVEELNRLVTSASQGRLWAMESGVGYYNRGRSCFEHLTFEGAQLGELARTPSVSCYCASSDGSQVAFATPGATHLLAGGVVSELRATARVSQIGWIGEDVITWTREGVILPEGADVRRVAEQSHYHRGMRYEEVTHPPTMATIQSVVFDGASPVGEGIALGRRQGIFFEEPHGLWGGLLRILFDKPWAFCATSTDGGLYYQRIGEERGRQLGDAVVYDRLGRFTKDTGETVIWAATRDRLGGCIATHEPTEGLAIQSWDHHQ